MPDVNTLKRLLTDVGHRRSGVSVYMPLTVVFDAFGTVSKQTQRRGGANGPSCAPTGDAHDEVVGYKAQLRRL